MSNTELNRVLELLMRIAGGERGARGETRNEPQHEETDALIVGLNMLAEDLEHERAMRLEAEALLQDERDAYQHSPAMLCSVEASTLTILKCNETLAARLGQSVESLTGRHVASLFAVGDRDAAAHSFAEAAAGSATAFPELALQGESDEMLVHTRISFSESPVERLRVVWRDVSRERQLEAQLMQAQKMQAIGRLSGGVAHDFNNILSVVLASACLAIEHVGRDHAAVEDLSIIEEAAHRGASLTRQLLAFSRQQVVRLAPVAMCELVGDLDRLLQRLLPKNIELVLDLPDAEVVALADSSQMGQVLVNLVVNARDAIATSGRIVIEVAGVTLDDGYADTHLDVSPGDYVLLTVTDNGEGMTSEVLSQVFEPFFTTKPVGQGSGLGLSMCYGIVRQSGGRIYVYSEVGHGTTVKVYLPRHDAAPKPVDSQSSTAATAGSETLLLVEDDEILRRLATRILGMAGYHVIAAENGVKALELLARETVQVDLLITDVVMPKMGGRELVDKLLVDYPDLRVLYVSGYTANSIVHNGVLEAGVEFLGKPFTPDQLLRTIREILGRSR